MKLTEAQRRYLLWLASKGGSGYLDRHSRLVAGGEVMPQGAWPAWLHLMAKGLIRGADDRIFLTAEGIAEAEG